MKPDSSVWSHGPYYPQLKQNKNQSIIKIVPLLHDNLTKVDGQLKLKISCSYLGNTAIGIILKYHKYLAVECFELFLTDRV